ncbi:MAG: hypothetical protein ACJKTH_03830 [Patescibacteria group bacterium UBA2163]
MNIFLRPALIIISILALTFLVGGLALSQYQPLTPNTVVLKDSGFSPKKLVIDSGDTVTFLNKSSHSLWVASDNHPLHEIYSEFDVGRPIKPGERWEFTFKKDGVWWYHDHLRPYFRGQILVGDVTEVVSCIERSDELSASEKQACWERELANTLETEGVKESFALFEELYENEPEFSSIGCHWMAHKLGEVEYGLYLGHKDMSKLEFPPETSYCGYGYYHGFLEHFLRDEPDYDLALEICENLTGREDELPWIQLNCYHAIGHGFVPEPLNIEDWGNTEKLVAPALTACDRLKETPLREQCLQGAFNVIADWMWNNQFGLHYSDDKPFILCASFESDEIARACYYEVAMKLNTEVNIDMGMIYEKHISTIPDDLIAGTIINSFAAGALGARILEDDFSDLVYDCRRLPQFLQTDCMKGLTGAFAAFGEPNREYEKALDFCRTDILTAHERDVCYWNITRTFKGIYTKEKVADICNTIEEPYQKYCSYDFVYE